VDLVVETMSILVQVNHGEERHTYKKKQKNTQSPKPNQLYLMVEIMYVIIGQ